MVPPIYQCVTGHSICSTCKDDLSECPACKHEIKDTQNFVLASVIQHIEYPCRNNRCRFKSKPKDIRQHEATCVYGEFPCPLKQYLNCNIHLIYNDLYEHVKNNHYENLVEMEMIKMPFDKDVSVLDCYIFRYGTRLFKLRYAYESESEEFRWSMEFIGPAKEADKYLFEIDICDMSGGNRRFYFKMPCSPQGDNKFDGDSNEGCYFLDLYQINTMMSDELCYRARIVEQLKC